MPHASRVVFRRVSLERSEAHERFPVVFCPRRLRVMPVEDCRSCERFLGLCVSSSDPDTYLRCANDLAAQSVVATKQRAPRVRSRAPVSEIASTPVRCVSADTTLRDVVEVLLSAPVGALPVVDDHGRPIGIVTKTDAMARYHDDELVDASGAEVTAGEIMTRGIYTIPHDAPITRAAAHMAYEQIHHLLVVSDTGEAVGIVSTLDIARWVAQSDDYVVPRRGRSVLDS